MPRRPALAACLVALFALVACEQIDAPGATALTGSEADIITIDSYFSPYSFGPLLRMYHFQEERAILKVKLDNSSAKTPLTAELVVFAPDEDREAVDAWINNQYNDALFPTAAEPVTRTDVSSAITITGRSPGELETGRSGESYQRTTVNFSVPEISAGRIRVGAFNDTVTVHVMMKAPQTDARASQIK